MTRFASSGVALVVLLVLAMQREAGAQQLAMADANRPRFLLASDSRLVPLDVDRTPLLARRVGLSLEGVPLKQALTEIASRASLRLAFSDNDIPLEKRVDLRAETITVAAALTDVLLGTGMDVVFGSDGGASLVKRNEAAMAQPGRVVGVVTDRDTHKGIAGAEVFLEGTNRHALTGEDGQYLLAEVEPGSYTLTARRIGYTKRSEKVTVGDGQVVAADFAIELAAARLGDVVVTAQKRSEHGQDVPVPVATVPAEDLTNSSQFRLQDYYSEIPGLSLTPADTRGAPTLAIRGITTGSFNPTVGITVDDVPYGATTSLGGGFAAPDMDPSDLVSVEVLRGPQGTLYGASSIGGLLKFVTLDPSTDRVSGRIQAGLTGAHNGDAAGYGLRGAGNLPLGKTFAVRASAFARRDPGYVDDPTLDIQGVNWGDAQGGRISALWRPSERFSSKVSALLQDVTQHGSSEVDLGSGLGDLQQNRVRGSGGYDRKIRAYSATMTAKLGGVDLTSLSGYNVNKVFDSQDFTAIFGPLTESLFGVTGTPTSEGNRTTKFTQEVRLSTPIGHRVEWLLGAFYTHESSRYGQDILAADPATGTRVGVGITDTILSTYAEYAAFTDLTFLVTDRLDVQIGGREGQNRQTYTETIVGPLDTLLYGLPSPIVNPEVKTKDNSFTYLVTPRFKVSADLMVYARVASGYRPGGPNPTSTIFRAPSSYQPDKTRNYEIGVKGAVLDRALTFDASLYYINWRDIQLFAVDPNTGAGYFANGSRAKSQGVEFSVEARPLTGLRIAGWIAWNDAVLTEALPTKSANLGAAGDRLPNSSRFSSNFSLDEDFPLARGLTGSLGGGVSYVGDREGAFPSTLAVPPERENLPGYAKTDLRAGLESEYWKLSFFITNVTDKRGALAGGLGTLNPNAFTYIRPRMAGLSLSKTF